MIETSYLGTYYNECCNEPIYLTEGAAKTLKKSAHYHLLAAELILHQLPRIQPHDKSLNRERVNFEGWEKCMKGVPRKCVYLKLAPALLYTLGEIVVCMYDIPISKSLGKQTEKLQRRLIAYLISRGLLMKSCNESEVS